METEKNRLIASSSKIGFMYIREKKFNDYVWNRYHILIAGVYLYFFKNSTDKRAAFWIYLKKSKIEVVQHIGENFAFVVIT